MSYSDAADEVAARPAAEMEARLDALGTERARIRIRLRELRRSVKPGQEAP